MARATEDELIARHFAPFAGAAGLGLRDDAALLTPRPGHDLVLTVDAIVAGIHFLADDPPETIAAKALGVNLSDLAAKGAEPVGFLLTLALPPDWTEDWLARFCAGLAKVSAAAACPLLGGDTVRASDALTISITALGEVPAGRMVARTSARPGDLLAVSGTIGDAVLGLALLQAGSTLPDLADADRDFLIGRYREPRPRLALARALRDHAHAAMDVSDGLVGDAVKLFRASDVSGAIDLDRVPFSPAARRVLDGDAGWRDRLVTGGDDYEILFSLPEAALPSFAAEVEACGLPVTVIGRVESGDGPPTFLTGGREHAFASTSFQHF